MINVDAPNADVAPAPQWRSQGRGGSSPLSRPQTAEADRGHAVALDGKDKLLNRDTYNAVAGDGVMVACSFCSSQNSTQYPMYPANALAQFDCTHCGVVVMWRPRQVWLRDQGVPLEMAVHPQPGDAKAARWMKDNAVSQLFTTCGFRPK